MKPFTRILPLIILLIGAALFPPAADARGNGVLSGTVVSAEGRGLVGAVVALFRQDDQGGIISLTRSDESGKYSLRDIAPGSYSIRASRLGYQVLTSSRVAISSDRTTTVNLVLQELLDFVSARNDPRNWDLKTVMRSTSDRRLIFRDLPGTTVGEGDGASFSRFGTVNVASSSIPGGDNYAVYPNFGDSGIVSNFAYAEPVSLHGRMIFSGQFTSGYDSLWRARNTFHYRPHPGRDYKFSVGYGRLNLNRLSVAPTARPAEFFSEDPAVRDSGVETLAIGFESSNEIFNTLAVAYGLDLSRINYGPIRNIWSPYFQVMYTPSYGWLVRTMMTSRRTSANSALELPDGDMINLVEPASISKINEQTQISQVRHSEVAVARKLDEDTTVEISVYRDRVDGPGTPFVMTIQSGSQKDLRAAQLRGDQDGQQGLRVEFARMLVDTVRSSVTYNYSSASGFAAPEGKTVSSDYVSNHLLDLLQRSYYHTLTGQLEAKIPKTRTQLQATVRWYPGSPISPIDPFADRLDAFTKGMSFSFRQSIPMPEFMGYTGHWQALVDIRNPFDQGKNFIPTSDGSLTLTRNPRTLRFGLNLNFF